MTEQRLSEIEKNIQSGDLTHVHVYELIKELREAKNHIKALTRRAGVIGMIAYVVNNGGSSITNSKTINAFQDHTRAIGNALDWLTVHPK